MKKTAGLPEPGAQQPSTASTNLAGSATSRPARPAKFRGRERQQEFILADYLRYGTAQADWPGLVPGLRITRPTCCTSDLALQWLKDGKQTEIRFIDAFQKLELVNLECLLALFGVGNMALFVNALLILECVMDSQFSPASSH